MPDRIRHISPGINSTNWAIKFSHTQHIHQTSHEPAITYFGVWTNSYEIKSTKQRKSEGTSNNFSKKKIRISFVSEFMPWKNDGKTALVQI